MKLERKSDHIKVLESDSVTLTGNRNLQCQNCKERYQLTAIKGDNNSLLCTNCGHKTPIRTIKHSRGLASPTIQQLTVIVQSSQIKERGKDRKPKGIGNRKKSELEESLLQRGYTIIDSQYVEPTR